MSTTFRPYAPDQMLLLPADLRAWLPEGHLAHHASQTPDGRPASGSMHRSVATGQPARYAGAILDPGAERRPTTSLLGAAACGPDPRIAVDYIEGAAAAN